MRIPRLSSSASAGKVRWGMLAPLAVLGLLGIVVWQAARDYYVQPSVSGAPLDIRLLGIRPDCSDELRDTMGRKIAESFYDLKFDQPWSATQLRRDFIFEVFAPTARVLTAALEIVPADREGFRVARQTQNLTLPDGRQRLIAETAFDRWFRRQLFKWKRNWAWRSPVRRVEAHLRYLLKQPPPTNQMLGQFAGPFAAGQTQTLSAGMRLIADTNFLSEQGQVAADFQLILTNHLNLLPFPVVALDITGRRLPCQRLRSQPSGRSWWHKFRVKHRALEEIARISVETLQEKTWHNLRIDYPDRPPRSIPEYRENVAKMLGQKQNPQAARRFTFRHAAEAIPVIEVVRGQGVDDVFRALLFGPNRVQLHTLPMAQQTKVRRAAAAWARTFGMRSEGLRLGLFGQWPEFVEPALDLLTDDSPDGDAAVARELFQASALLQTNAILRLRGLLQQPKPWTPVGPLIDCLGRSRNPIAADTLLQLAHDERLWIWWPAAKALAQSTALPAEAEPPAWLLPRLVVIQEKNRVQYGRRLVLVPEAVAQTAFHELPRWLASDLQPANRSVLLELYRRLIAHADRDTATPALVHFLHHFAEFRSLPPDRSGEQTIVNWMAVNSIQRLNQWHGLNLGPWGNNPQIEPGLPLDVTAIYRAIEAIGQWDQRRQDAGRSP